MSADDRRASQTFQGGNICKLGKNIFKGAGKGLIFLFVK